MAFFSISVKEQEHEAYLYGVRLADINLLKKLYGRSVNYLFKDRRRSWFNTFYAVPRSLLFELTFLFKGLYSVTKFRRYRLTYENFLRDTWVGRALDDSGVTLKVDVDKILDEKMALPLLPYQQEFVKFYFKNKEHRHLRGGFLAFDQGLGKTATAIGVTQVIDAPQTIIVCPNTLKWGWFLSYKKFVKRYKDDEVAEKEIYVQGISKNISDVKQKKIIIVNIESLRKVMNELPKTTKKAIVVDESHILKELTSARTKLMLKLIKEYNVTDVLLQSGTPIKGIPREILPILVILDKNLTPDALAIYKKLVLTKNTNLMKVLNQKFNFVGYRKTKLEVNGVLNLPPKIRQDVFITLPTVEKYTITNVKKAINKFIKDYIAKEAPNVKKYRKLVDGLVYKYKDSTKYLSRNYDAYMALIKKIRSDVFYDGPDKPLKQKYEKHLLKKMSNTDKKLFREFAGRANNLSGSALGKAIGEVYMGRHREMVIDIAKYGVSQFLKVLKQSKAKKVIAMTSYPEAAEQFIETMEKEGFKSALATGKQSFEERRKNIEAFMKDPEVTFLAGTLQVLSVGLTLIESDTVLFLNEPWRWVDKNQAEDRVHRYGQVNTCYSITCLLRSSEPTLSSRNNDIVMKSKEVFQLIIEGKHEKNAKHQVLKMITKMR